MIQIATALLPALQAAGIPTGAMKPNREHQRVVYMERVLTPLLAKVSTHPSYPHAVRSYSRLAGMIIIRRPEAGISPET